jgi:predicted ATPase
VQDSFFGREQDVAALTAFVHEAGERGGAVLLTGDAGVGKTELVNLVVADARRRACGCCVRRVRSSRRR